MVLCFYTLNIQTSKGEKGVALIRVPFCYFQFVFFPKTIISSIFLLWAMSASACSVDMHNSLKKSSPSP